MCPPPHQTWGGTPPPVHPLIDAHVLTVADMLSPFVIQSPPRLRPMCTLEKLHSFNERSTKINYVKDSVYKQNANTINIR